MSRKTFSIVPYSQKASKFWIYSTILLFTWLHLAKSVLANEKSKGCEAIIAIAPPHTDDPLYSDELVRVIEGQLRDRRKSTCGELRIIPQDRSRKVFDRLGLNAFETVPPVWFKETQVAFLVTELEATHVVFTLIDRDADELEVRVRPISFELGFDEAVLSFRMPLSKVSLPLRRLKPWVRYLSLVAPNSASMGSTKTELLFDTKREGIDQSYSQNNALSDTVSSVSFDKIQHFRNFRPFDYGGLLYPSSFLFSVDQTTSFVDKPIVGVEPRSYEDVRISVSGACVTLNAEGVVHVPIGSFYIGYGVGPCVYSRRQGNDDRVHLLDHVVRTRGVYRAFFSERWFFFSSFDSLTFLGHRLYDDENVYSRSVKRSGAGIGYYRPDMEHDQALYLQRWASRGE